jgi:hypothetical protein
LCIITAASTCDGGGCAAAVRLQAQCETSSCRRVAPRHPRFMRNCAAALHLADPSLRVHPLLCNPFVFVAHSCRFLTGWTS